jgi:hypothetical protein
VPIPRFASWEEFNAHLLTQCQKRRERKLRGHERAAGSQEALSDVRKDDDPGIRRR